MIDLKTKKFDNLFNSLKSLNKVDLVDAITTKINNANPNHKKAFLISFIISFIAYSFFIFNMTYVGDDLSIVAGAHMPNYLITHGRYYLFLTHTILYLTQILPGVEETLGIITLIFAGFYISKLWKVSDWKQIVIIQVFLAIFPSQVLLFNFNNAPLPVSLGILCGVLGLIQIQKRLCLKNFLITFALFTVPFGTYQTTLFSLLAIMLGQVAIFMYEEEKISPKRIYQFFLVTIFQPLFCLATCHIIWNKLIIPILIKIHMTAQEIKMVGAGGRNIQHISLPQSTDLWISRFSQIKKYPFDLYSDLFPHLIVSLYVTSAICIFISLFKRYNWYSSIIRFITIVAIFIVASCVIISPILFVKDFSALPFRSLSGLAISLLILIIIPMRQNSVFIKNIYYTLSSLFIATMIIFAISYGLRVSIQNRADFLEANRIVHKIEELPNSQDIFSGKIPVLYITNPKSIKFSTLNNRINFPTRRMNQLNLHPSSVLNVFKFIKPVSDMNIKRLKALPNDAPEGLVKKALSQKEWPERNSVFMFDGQCVILMDSALPNISFYKDSFDEAKSTLLKINSNNFIKSTEHFSNSLKSGVNIKNKIVELEYSNKYPSFSIKKFEPLKNQNAVIKISYETPKKTFLRVFYKTNMDHSYHGSRMIGFYVKKGYNDVYIAIKDKDFSGDLRIDPGIMAGTYKVKEIIVKSIP